MGQVGMQYIDSQECRSEKSSSGTETQSADSINEVYRQCAYYGCRGPAQEIEGCGVAEIVLASS